MGPLVTPVKCGVEGPIDEVVLRRILDDVGLPCAEFYGRRGKQHLVNQLPKYNRSARYLTWIVLLDLDRDATCAPAYVSRLVPNREHGMHLRIAVRAVEAWLLGDAERLAAFLAVPRSLVPPDPDAEPDPKAALINVARRSTRRDVREAMAPVPGSGRAVGYAYRAYLTKYVKSAPDCWRPRVAAQYSRSLAGCITALEALKDSLLPLADAHNTPSTHSR